MTLRTSERRRFFMLDGLRGVAAMAIAARHAPFLWEHDYPTQVLRNSYLAVDLFFVLSGFVLAHAYGERLRSGLTSQKFISMRLYRLYPLYGLSLVLAAGNTFLLRSAGKEFDGLTFVLDVIRALFLMPAPLHSGVLFPLNIPAWSLSVELVGNFVFGVFYRDLHTGRTILFTFCMGALLAVTVLTETFGFGQGNGPLDGGAASTVAGLVRMLFSFFAGVSVFQIWRKYGDQTRSCNALVPIVVLIALAAFPRPEIRAVVDLFVIFLLFPAVIFVGAHECNCHGGDRVLAFFGEISYAVYILQYPLYNMFSFGVRKVAGDVGTNSALGLVAVLFVVGGAAIAHRYVDKPIRRFVSARISHPG